MASDMKRFTVSLPIEFETELNQLKKEQFYDKSQSEMIRFLIQQGLKTLNVKASKEKRQAS